MFWIVLLIIFIPIKLFLPTRVVGRKNLPKGKAIYASNHQTNFDIMIIACGIFRRMYALGKAELFKGKFLSWFMRSLGCVRIERGKPDIDAVKQVFSILNKKNKPIVIFPTGTRNSSPDEIQDLKNGVAMFSAKTHSPIVPMVLVKKPGFLKFNKLVIGKPLDLTKYEGRKADKELYAEISQDLSNAMEQLLEENTKKSKKKVAVSTEK